VHARARWRGVAERLSARSAGAHGDVTSAVLRAQLVGLALEPLPREYDYLRQNVRTVRLRSTAAAWLAWSKDVAVAERGARAAERLVILPAGSD
jgi:hypothetical protein